MKKIFSFIAVLSLLMMGCEGFDLGQGGKIEDIISAIDLAKLDGVSGEGGSITIPFKPQFDYEVYANKEWISVSPEVGTSTDEFLTITIKRNETGAERSGTIYLELSNNTIFKIPVLQKPLSGETPEPEQPVLELVGGSTYNIDGSGGNLSVRVQTNTEYDVVIPSNATSWLSVADTRAMREDVLTFTATKNDTGAARSATVKLVYSGNEVSFTIDQEALAQDKPVEAQISVSPKTASVSGEGETLTVTVTSNVAWNATCSVAGVSISPLSGNGNGSANITVPATTEARTITVDFVASNATSSATASVVISQSAKEVKPTLTPGEHQDYLEKTGLRLLEYFNPEDSRALIISITDMIEAGGFDFELEASTRTTQAGASKAQRLAKRLVSSLLGITRFSPESIVRLSTTLILPEDDGTYTLNDYKGKQYIFNYQTGKWKESLVSNENKITAIWGTSVATLTWVDSDSSWEGYVDYNYKAKVENIPSKVNFEIMVDNKLQFSTAVELTIPSNYAVQTKSNIWLNGDYKFIVLAEADRTGAGGSVVMSKGDTTLATAGGAVAINDMTDSKNWWEKYYCEWCEDFHTDFNWDYAPNYVKTGTAYATIFDVCLQAEGNLRTIIDQGKKIEDTSSYDGATLLSNYINSNASALLYYTGSKEKIADIKSEPVAYEGWYWDDASQSEKLKTYYDPMPVLVFTDGSKFAVDDYFTEIAFGNLIDAAEALWESYEGLVE